MELTITQISELPKVAKQILALNSDKKIFLFNAEMGAGKTTLIKQLCSELGVTETVSSPTFSIVNEYQGSTSTVYHFDCYRMENPEEAYDIGIEEYLFSDAYCFIEWPEIITNFLPEEDKCVSINIFVEPEGRRFQF